MQHMRKTIQQTSCVLKFKQVNVRGHCAYFCGYLCICKERLEL